MKNSTIGRISDKFLTNYFLLLHMIVDCHCHLDHKWFSEDIDAVIKRAEKAGVKAIIQNGIDKQTNRITLELANKYEIVKAALGMYPQSSLKRETDNIDSAHPFEQYDVDSEIDFIRSQKDKIIALGEVGLDYKETDERAEQQDAFRKILNLAKEINKPVIVHSRKAEADVLDIIDKSKYNKIVLHCFSGKKKLMERAIKRGYFFTIPTCVVRSQQFQMLVDMLPLRQMLTETDAPYLSPFKDQRNEPAYIIEAIQKIAEIKKMDVKEIKNTIFMNYQGLFS
jgi:TatD DNase family protein